MLKIPDLTCTEGVRRLGGVDRVMILQKLHLCEIPDSSLSPGYTPLRPPVHPSSSQPSASSPYGDALLPVQPSPVVLVTTRSFTANRRSPSMLFSFSTTQGRCKSEWWVVKEYFDCFVIRVSLLSSALRRIMKKFVEFDWNYAFSIKISFFFLKVKLI